MLYRDREVTTSIMTCIGAETHPIWGPKLRLQDSKGIVEVRMGVTYTGEVRRALQLNEGDDISLGMGRKVEVFFGINGNAQRLTAVKE